MAVGEGGEGEIGTDGWVGEWVGGGGWVYFGGKKEGRVLEDVT